MRNSLKAVLFGAFSVMFSAGLHAETHQHGDMNTASDASVPAGTYRVDWRAVSSDTHPITGNYTFTVK